MDDNKILDNDNLGNDMNNVNIPDDLPVSDQMVNEPQIDGTGSSDASGSVGTPDNDVAGSVSDVVYGAEGLGPEMAGLSEINGSDPEAGEIPGKSGKGKKGKKEKNKGSRRKKGEPDFTDPEDFEPKVTRKSKRIMRIEALENALSEGEVDPETIVSMYLPRRRARNFGSALLRLDRWRLILLFLLLLIAVLFIVAFMQEKMGNFTINLNRLELFRKGIAISADADFTDPTARLTANNVDDATNISIEDLPADLDDIDGDHSGRNYMAYTYYVRNAGKEDVGYVATLTLESYAKGAEEAVRVALWRNGKVTVYAEPSKKNGEPEEGCVNFVDHDTVCILSEENFLVGNVDKYTIVIWMEGDDPECVDAIVGGSVEFEMDINALNYEDTNLFTKFVSDIKDTLTGDKPIAASGNDAPDYYDPGEVKWKNRRNK